LRTEQASDPECDPRVALGALALRFPGALRELDQLPLGDIEQRLAALEAVLAGTLAVQLWMRLQVSYHGFMRAALRIKRIALTEQRDHARVWNALSEHYRPAADEPPLASLDAAAIAAILKPPSGRLNPFVYARVADEHGVEVEQVREALFPR